MDSRTSWRSLAADALSCWIFAIVKALSSASCEEVPDLKCSDRPVATASTCP
jgi:hypothetical protein